MRVVLITIAALLLVPAALAATSPHVRLANRAPAAVSGAGFRPGERVLVRVSNGNMALSKRILTGPRGGFTVRFAHDLPMLPCGQLSIRATGALGDLAVWKTPPQVCGAQPPVLQ